MLPLKSTAALLWVQVLNADTIKTLGSFSYMNSAISEVQMTLRPIILCVTDITGFSFPSAAMANLHS